MKGFKTVDQFIEAQEQWQDELIALRAILKQTPMQESIKWGIPVYTFNNKNIVGLSAFKSYFGLWFYQGVFLKDKSKLLINAQEGKTKAMRQWRHTSAAEINPELVLQYALEAVENQKQGKEVAIVAKKKLAVPEIMKAVFTADTNLAEKFKALTHGRQQEYIEHIVTAKQEKTKFSRLDKILPLIKQGVGLHDKYKK
jgi:uncharacterized protein YdeI (YjbR/CyaY-like superfamily)